VGRFLKTQNRDAPARRLSTGGGSHFLDLTGSVNGALARQSRALGRDLESPQFLSSNLDALLPNGFHKEKGTSVNKVQKESASTQKPKETRAADAK